jgi:hypothetical protein
VLNEKRHEADTMAPACIRRAAQTAGSAGDCRPDRREGPRQSAGGQSAVELLPAPIVGLVEQVESATGVNLLSLLQALQRSRATDRPTPVRTPELPGTFSATAGNCLSRPSLFAGEAGKGKQVERS